LSTTHTLRVPGARLHSEIRGSGPLLLLLGAPMPSGAFATLADALAGTYTVVTTDPRGIARSRVDDPQQDATPEQRADDARLLIDAVGGGPAHVFGSSGGAVTGLALVERHPGAVRTVVAHEPPLMGLLPDAVERLAGVDDVYETYLKEGQQAAWAKFFTAGAPEPQPGEPQSAEPRSAQPESSEPQAGEQPAAPAAPQPAARPTPEQVADGAFMLGHMLRPIARYLPDLAALRAVPGQVVAGAGAASAGTAAHRAVVALAERLGSKPVFFPGGHIGFTEHPAECAGLLRGLLERRTV
jgi:pimeloyl-ACP methyl ester carboxylesterase